MKLSYNKNGELVEVGEWKCPYCKETKTEFRVYKDYKEICHECVDKLLLQLGGPKALQERDLMRARINLALGPPSILKHARRFEENPGWYKSILPKSS